MVRWRVLGPLEVLAASGWAVVPAPKWRSLLAVLLAAPGDVVSIERLIDELWRENPPAAARKLVNGYVLRVRRLIGDRGGQILVTQVPGYRLAIAPVDVDTGRFEELLAAGRRALTCADAGQAAKLLADGLALWRGAALADVPPGPVATAEAARLEELGAG
jgi:DNA-binding SARP family transcriptional activator